MNYREMMALSLGCYMCTIEQKNYVAISDELWINVMQEELSQFGCNEVWILVQNHQHVNVIRDKVDLQEHDR